MKNKKLGNYVVQCIKTNNNKFGFGFNHKIGQFVSSTGKGTQNINNACIYNDRKLDDYGCLNTCGLDECAEDWTKYYKYIPVKIVVKINK